jgi:hypothetical protein
MFSKCVKGSVGVGEQGKRPRRPRMRVRNLWVRSLRPTRRLSIVIDKTMTLSIVFPTSNRNQVVFYRWFTSPNKFFFPPSIRSGFLSTLPKNCFYEDHTTLVVILCTLQQFFPYKLLIFQCWCPCGILHWTIHTKTCSHKKTGLSKFGSGERVSSIFMFLVPWQSWPSETSFSWNKILPWKKFLVKDGEINSVTRVFRTGWLRKFEGIRINLSHLGLVSGLCQCSRVFQHWNTGTRSYTSPVFPSKVTGTYTRCSGIPFWFLSERVKGGFRVEEGIEHLDTVTIFFFVVCEWCNG